eukprot:6213648-Pleurochrysis_carterae.AAC.1
MKINFSALREANADFTREGLRLSKCKATRERVDRLRVDKRDAYGVAVERILAGAHVVVDEAEILEVARMESDVVRLGREESGSAARSTAVRRYVA